jgi:hypothetical protein
MTRRKFFGTTLAGGATLIAGGSNMIFAANPPAPAEAGTNSLFRLGGDLSVNRLGFGAMRITGESIWGWPPDRDNARKVLRRAVELGVDLIDTADAYGPETSELLIAEALHPYPKDLVIATKGGLTRPGPGQWVPNGRPEYLTRCVENSLKRLQLERIDLYQLHRIDPKVPMEESLGALKKMQEAGKIRHVGLSEVSAEEIRSGAQGPADCERAEPVQHWQPEVGKNADLLREGRIGVYAVVTDWWKQGVEGQCAGSGGQGLSRQRCATGPRLASSPISRDVADPWHVFGRASGREHGCC